MPGADPRAHALVQELRCLHTQVDYAGALKETHKRLLDSYTDGGKRPLYSVVDDGYIVQVRVLP